MKSPTRYSAKNEIVSLTSLRGVAAMGVVLLHLRPQLVSVFDVNIYTNFIAKSYLWVDFFFILSGFIMCHVYGSLFEERLTSKNYFKFICLRLIRIYPLHLATLAVFIGFELLQLILTNMRFLGGVTVFENQTSIFSLIANILLIHSWDIVDVPGWNAPSWSISAEFFVYLLFPFLLFTFIKLKKIGFFLMGLAGFGLLIGLQISKGDLFSTVQQGLIRALGGFLIGMVVFYLNGIVGKINEQLINVAQAIAVIGIVWFMHIGGPDIAVIPFIALLILFSSNDKGWVGSFCRVRPMYFLGVISYSLYMTHSIIILIFNKRWATLIPDLNFIFETKWVFLLTAVQLVLIILISYLFYTFVEDFSRRRLRQMFISNKTEA